MTDTTSAILKMIGGSPLNKVIPIIANKLPIPNINSISGLEGMLSQVMQNGIGSILQNPLASTLSNLNNAVNNIVGNLSSDIATALTGAGGLQSALSSLGGVTDLLSGVANVADGQFGLLDVLSHASVLDGLGGVSIPSGMGLDSVLAPINLLGTLQHDVTNFVNGLPSALASGALSSSSAVAQIQSYISTINGAMSTSTSALSTLHSAMQPMAHLSSVAANLISGPQSVQSFLTSVVAPGAMANVQAALNAHVASIVPDLPQVINEATSLSAGGH